MLDMQTGIERKHRLLLLYGHIHRWVIDLVECPFEECLQGRDPILGN